MVLIPIASPSFNMQQQVTSLYTQAQSMCDINIFNNSKQSNADPQKLYILNQRMGTIITIYVTVAMASLPSNKTQTQFLSELPPFDCNRLIKKPTAKQTHWLMLLMTWVVKHITLRWTRMNWGENCFQQCQQFIETKPFWRSCHFIMDLQSFEIQFEFKSLSAPPIQFESDGPIRKFTIFESAMPVSTA